MIAIRRAALALIVEAAIRARPREACGLLIGTGTCIDEALETPNLAFRADRFEIDPAAHIALMRRLRGSGRDIAGVFHSHPDGSPELSATDRAAACYPGWIWLIAAPGDAGATPVRAFRHEAPGQFTPLGAPRAID